MKITQLALATIIALACGCGKEPAAQKTVLEKMVGEGIPHWDISVVEIENSEHAVAHDAYKNSANLTETLKRSDQSAGNFVFSSKEYRRMQEQGWELVAAVPQLETIISNGQPFTRTAKIILFFKRPA